MLIHRKLSKESSRCFFSEALKSMTVTKPSIVTPTQIFYALWCKPWKSMCFANFRVPIKCPFCANFNTLRQRQNGCHLPDDIFKCIFLNENSWISIMISLKFVPKVPIKNILALVLKVAWRHQAPSHYLNQWWLIYWRIYASPGLNELVQC